MDNNEQALKLLQQIAPDLVEIRRLMTEMKVEPEVVEDIIKGAAMPDEMTGYLHYPITNAGAKPIDIMRGLYLLANIKRFSRWGKVTFLMQDGRVVRVQQEQGYKSD